MFAQRWEKSEGLPVHRHGGAKAGIWASKIELDEWWKAREIQPEPDTLPVEEEPQPTIPPQLQVPPTGSRWRRAAFAAWGRGVACHRLVASSQESRRPKRPSDLARPLFALASSESGRTRAILVGGHPDRLYVSPDRLELHIVDESAPRVTVLNLDTQNRPYALTSSNSDNDGVFGGRADPVPGNTHDGLYVVDRGTFEITAVREGVKGPIHDLAITSDGKTLYWQ